MQVLIDAYQHRTGEHCATTALRNVLRFHGLDLSEPMVFGLASGLGFAYLRNDEWSPTRMFHGRTQHLESDFCRNTGIPFEEPTSGDDDGAWLALKRRIEAGRPVMLSTDTFYLGYHGTTSHFPGHQVVAVGYDDEAGVVLLADRKFESYRTCSVEELRRARNAPDYPVSCANQYLDLPQQVELPRPLEAAIRVALLRNCRELLAGGEAGCIHFGIGGMRALAADFAGWRELPDWSWAARFGYQVIVKRGSGGSFFRSLYADFLDEAARFVAPLEARRLPQRMREIAARWRDLAALLKQQSERERCAPELFQRAGVALAELAEEESSFFTELRRTL